LGLENDRQYTVFAKANCTNLNPGAREKSDLQLKRGGGAGLIGTIAQKMDARDEKFMVCIAHDDLAQANTMLEEFAVRVCHRGGRALIYCIPKHQHCCLIWLHLHSRAFCPISLSMAFSAAAFLYLFISTGFLSNQPAVYCVYVLCSVPLT